MPASECYRGGIARTWRPDIAAVAVMAAAMIAMHSVHFGSPPLDVDELSFFLMNLSLMSEPGSEWYQYSQGTGAHAGPFPFMYRHYVGALGAYASMPFQYALGPGVEAVRLYNLFTMVAIQAALYVTAREMFSRHAAIVSAGAFTVLPAAVLFSRQGVLYDWIILAVAVLMLYFGTRFIRGGSVWYLGAVILSAWLIIWAYLSSLWFVLGVIAALPICVASFRARGLKVTRKVVLAGAVFVLVGSAPFMAHYVISPDHSSAPFILQVIDGDRQYMSSETDNSDFAGNLGARVGHVRALLAEPFTGLWFARVHVSADEGAISPLSGGPHDATFLALLSIGVAVALAEIWQRRRYSRMMAGLLVVLAVMLVSSTFTISVLNPWQLGIMLPFVFLLIGGGTDSLLWRITRLKPRLPAASRRYMLLAAVALVAALQAPHIYAGMDLLGQDPENGYMQPSSELARHLDDNGLAPVTLDYYTHRTLFFLLEGEYVPIDPGLEARLAGVDFSGRMLTAEDAGLVRDDLLFVMYSFPELSDCDGAPLPLDIGRSQCSQVHFVESAAERNGLGVAVKDFDLPNGLPYYRTFQFERGESSG